MICAYGQLNGHPVWDNVLEHVLEYLVFETLVALLGGQPDGVNAA